MYYQVAFVPGGQAIGFLESFYSKIARRLKKLVGRDKLRGLVPEQDLAMQDEEQGAAPHAA